MSRRVVYKATKDRAEYIAACKQEAPSGATIDRCSLRPGDRTIRHTGEIQTIARSFRCEPHADTWALVYTDGDFSLAGYFYPERLAR